MDDYPITLGGDSGNADGDNRLNQGGCFVGRDVHSNPLKDVDGAETPAHLNAVGQWLADNVFHNQAGLAGSRRDTRGIWCTNCHTQLGQEIWRHEDCNDLIHGDCVNNIRAESLQRIANSGGRRRPEIRSLPGWIRTIRICTAPGWVISPMRSGIRLFRMPTWRPSRSAPTGRWEQRTRTAIQRQHPELLHHGRLRGQDQRQQG